MTNGHTTSRLCPACGLASAGRLIGAFPVTSAGTYSRPTFDLIECSCSLIFLSPLPTDQDLRNLYQDASQFDAPEYVTDDRVNAILRYIKQRFDFLVLQYTITQRPLRVLEVGAGWAWMCRAAKAAGFPTLTVAQDISDECAEKCPWVDHYIIDETVSKKLDESGPFDIISATHVLEHVPEPVDFLRRLGSLLTPAGVIFVTMPHRPRDWDGERQSWLEYSYHHIPAHLQYFSQASLRETAEKAGLNVNFWDQSHEEGEAMEAHLSLKSEAERLNEVSSDGVLNLVQVAVQIAAANYQHQFENAKPFKHLLIEQFFDVEFAESLLADFPAFNPEKAQNEFGEIGGKAVNEQIEQIGPSYLRLSAYLRSKAFLNLMSELTGIPDLLPDPKMYGGGTHENLHGQELDPHVDFNYDPPTKLHRRLNLLVYLNKDWSSEWGGQIELHSDPWNPATNQITAFVPSFNRALIFETNEYSWHGFPKINLPEDERARSRKSISVYLYTIDRPQHEIVPEHSTFYVQRPLAAHIRPGHVLTESDITEIGSLLARRDGWIQQYHKTEMAVSSQMGMLHKRISALEELHEKISNLTKLARKGE